MSGIAESQLDDRRSLTPTSGSEADTRELLQLSEWVEAGSERNRIWRDELFRHWQSRLAGRAARLLKVENERVRGCLTRSDRSRTQRAAVPVAVREDRLVGGGLTVHIGVSLALGQHVHVCPAASQP